ncbi:MAG: LytTR family DNA-binding domain-containing protein [Bacilli bacterium]|nr:LytTR family DNA-binding domain-containing protein [Bacilli bacterium]
MEINIAIVEDENDEIIKLKSFLEKFSNENSISFAINVYSDGQKFIQNFKNDQYHIILMDIELPGLDGFNASKKLREIDKDVVLIFITNLAQYAIKGYEVDALDFALKPLNYNDFELKLKKGMRHIKREKYLYLKGTDNAIINISVNDIVFIETDHHYLIIHLADESTIRTRKSMKEMTSELKNYSFSLSNSGYLVNLRYVERIDNDSVLVGSHQLLISRRKRNDLIRDFNNYLIGETRNG